MIKGGNNIGRTAVLTKVEKHDGNYDIIYCKDPNGKEFSTRADNVFVIGNNKSEITLMKSHNLKSIIEERDISSKRKPRDVDDVEVEADDN